MDFLILKGACGSCPGQLPFSSVRSQKSTLKKKFVPFKNSKRFFINTIKSKWKRSGACACDPQYQPKVTCTPMWCSVYVCWQGAGDPDNVFIMFFHHEINHAPMAFSRTKFSRRRRRYIRLVARDLDRFARLISAPAPGTPAEVFFYLVGKNKTLK